MTPLKPSPAPAGPESKVCVYCHHPCAKVVLCGDENCPNPWIPHFHCVWTGCTDPCKPLGICRPDVRKDTKMKDDLAILNVVRFKLATDGSMTPNREDIRDVGTIRAKYNFAKQRDDETYDQFVNRLISAVEAKMNETVRVEE